MGIVEGITEFLPVSSTGHLIIFGHFLGFNDDFGKTFDIAIQLGAIISVLIYFREKIFTLIQNSATDQKARNFLISLFIAFLPVAVMGLLIHKWIKAMFFNPLSVGTALIVGGIAIILIEKKSVIEEKEDQVEDVSFRQAFLIGCAQCFSLFPGVSRSAATILGGLIFGLGRTAAVEFSFFLAIPTMFAATIYSLVKDMGALSYNDLKILGIGFMVSLVVALGVIAWLMGFIKNHTFVPFAWYRIIFGSFLLFILI